MIFSLAIYACFALVSVMLILAHWHPDQNQLLANSKPRHGGMQIISHQKKYPEGSL